MIIVKGMDFPKDCDSCSLCDTKWVSDDDGEAWAFCMPRNEMICQTFTGSDKEVAKAILKKPKWCPLVEVVDE